MKNYVSSIGDELKLRLIKYLITMKLIVLFVLVSFFQVQAGGGYAQTVSLSKHNVSIVEVFREIKRQTNYNVISTSKLIKETPLVSIEMKDASLKDALNQLLVPVGLSYIIEDNSIVIKKASGPLGIKTTNETLTIVQQREVTGKVADQNGEPLVGVSVRVKGKSEGATTNKIGFFSINANPGDILIFSYIGFIPKELHYTTQNSLEIKLEVDNTAMEEVVVVGYSTRRQSELSSSVTVVGEKELQKGVTSGDLGTMLQGKVPGLVVSNASGHPQRGTNIVIRGVGSIGAGYSPLYVVDGIIGGSADPSDIASITVLKDAAATGLYGSRAANGVIVITTKSGQNGKTKINYTGSMGVSHHQDGNLSMMNSKELYENRKIAGLNYYNDQVGLGNAAFTGRTFDEYFERTVPSSVLNTNSYWPTLLTRTGYVNKHHLSVAGGNQATTFYLGGNVYSELGTLLGEKFNSLNLRGNLKHQITEKLAVSWRVNTGFQKYPNDPQNGQESVSVQYFTNMPWDPVYEADGITPYNPYKSGQWYGNSKANYFYDSEHYNDLTKEMNFNSDLQLDYKINDWMSFSTSNRWSFSGSDWSQLLDKYHFQADFDDGRLSQTYSYRNTLLTSNLLKMNHSIGDNNFSAILGQEYNYNRMSNINAIGVDIPIGLDVLNATGSPKSVSGGKTETDFLSYFGQIDYNYLNRYFLVGSVRRDASSLFGANNKWATFYSLGASWILNKENFLKDVSWIDLLKARVSYGTTGNANISPYLSLGTYAFNINNTYNGASGARPARLENPDLTWETAYTTNVGLELSVFRRIKLELDFYNRDNKDLLQNVPLSSATGFPGQQRNVGSVRNRGIDVNLTTVNLEGDFRWETNFNVNVNRNKVLALNQGQDIASGTMRISEGRPLRYLYMKDWGGVDPQTGDPLWVRWEDENGNIIHGADKKNPTNILKTNNYNEASNLFVRSAYPDFTGGIRNDFFYKDLSLSILCNFVSGQTINFAQRTHIDDDGAVLSKNQMNPYKDWVRWEKPGDIATHPQLVLGGNLNSNQPSSRYLEDASYLRIQNVTLNYNFSKLFSGLSVYARVDNLIVFTKFSGTDPDINIESPVAGQDKWGANYGATRKVIFGVNLNL